MHEAVKKLQAEHKRMEVLWAAVRTPLSRWSRPGAADKVDQQTRDDVESFRAIYGGHIDTEESLVFPAARAQMPDGELVAMGQAMQARRRR